MSHIMLFGLTTLGLALAGLAAGAGACEMPHADHAATPVHVAAATAATETAAIKTFQFRPKAIEIPTGTTVTWINEDNIDHTVTSGTPEAPDPDFDSGAFGKGQSFSATFDRPGEYAYFCAKHKSMRGTVKVLPAE
jgi:plastocyanin